MRKIVLISVLAILFSFSICAQGVNNHNTPMGGAVKLKITAGQTVVEGVLNDTPTARAFVQLLPVTLSMRRYDERGFNTRLGNLPKTGTLQSGFANGDIAFWAPGELFTLFYAKGGTVNVDGLIILGRITSDLSVFHRFNSPQTMLFEIAD
jgi:hypothetical protein